MSAAPCVLRSARRERRTKTILECVPPSVGISPLLIAQECDADTQDPWAALRCRPQAPDIGSLSVCPVLGPLSGLFLGYPSCINKAVLEDEASERPKGQNLGTASERYESTSHLLSRLNHEQNSPCPSGIHKPIGCAQSKIHYLPKMGVRGGGFEEL